MGDEMSNPQQGNRMDRDAHRMFSRGLWLMLAGVLLSVICILLMPQLDGGARVALALSGIAVLVVTGIWTGAGWRMPPPNASEE